MTSDAVAGVNATTCAPAALSAPPYVATPAMRYSREPTWLTTCTVSPSTKWPWLADARSMTISSGATRRVTGHELHRVELGRVLPCEGNRDGTVAVGVEQAAVVTDDDGDAELLCFGRLHAVDRTDGCERVGTDRASGVGAALVGALGLLCRAHHCVSGAVHVGGDVVVGLLDGVGQDEGAGHERDAE